MKFLKTLPVLAGAAVLLSACADEIVQPIPSESLLSASEAPAFAMEAGNATRHLVMFRGAAPRNFDDRVAELGGTVVLNHKIGIAIVEGLDASTAPALQKSINARFVEEEPQFQLLEPAEVREPLLANLTSVEDPTQAILYSEQWNMHQVNAEAAWAVGRLGSPAVTVAILDTGIDYLLPDFQGRVDLSRSASFVPLDDLYANFYFPGRHPSTDLHYHGTNVATQVATNAWAFAGVTSKTTLMSVKVCSFFPGVGCPGVTEGILHAIDNGADVINMSLGGWFRKSAFPGQVAFYNAIMNYARQQGVTVVVAAGNDAIDLDRNLNVPIRDGAGNIIDRIHIPSFFSTYCDANHVICVSATRRDDVPASYTNFGRSAIDVAAPGGDSGDWVWSLCPQTSLIYFCEDGYYPIGLAGTSMAAPHVAGLAALAVEDVGRSPAQVRTYIRNSADAVASKGNGTTAHFGRGRINVGNAVGAGQPALGGGQGQARGRM